MRLILFFDLPIVSSTDRHFYSVFHRFLIRNGFLMLQKSVYSKLVLNPTAANAVLANLRKNKPPEGLIQVICITEKQFSRCEYIIGEFSSEIIDSEERLVVL